MKKTIALVFLISTIACRQADAFSISAFLKRIFAFQKTAQKESTVIDFGELDEIEFDTANPAVITRTLSRPESW